MREILLYNWVQVFLLLSLRGPLLGILAVVNARHLILPVTYTEWVFNTAHH